MAGEHGHRPHLWLLPYNDFVLRVAVRAHEFVDGVGVAQTADLTASVDPVHGLESQGVPESDASVGCSASTTERTMLVRRPRNCLNGSHVLSKLCHRLGLLVPAPYHQFIVVASGSQLLLIWTPFEPAYLLLVAFKLGEVVLSLPHVPVQDGLVPRPSAEERRVPGNAPDTPVMPITALDDPLLVHVPLLQDALAGAYCQVGA